MENYVEKLMMIVVCVRVYFQADISLKHFSEFSTYVVVVIGLPLLFLPVPHSVATKHTIAHFNDNMENSRTLTQKLKTYFPLLVYHVDASSPPSTAAAATALLYASICYMYAHYSTIHVYMCLHIWRESEVNQFLLFVANWSEWKW